MALCPDCSQPVDINEGDLVIGDIVTCEECGAQLEVVALNELELQPVMDEEELDDEDLFDEDAEEEDYVRNNGRHHNFDDDDY